MEVEPMIDCRTGLSPHLPAAANDPGPPASAPAANDNWIEVVLPISIGVLAEEIVILDAFLRVEILALFD